MKAIVQDRYGSADVLEFRDIEEPTVGAGDVLVRVHAAGCGPDVWHFMAGMPYICRYSSIRSSDASLVAPYKERYPASGNSVVMPLSDQPGPREPSRICRREPPSTSGSPRIAGIG